MLRITSFPKLKVGKSKEKQRWNLNSKSTVIIGLSFILFIQSYFFSSVSSDTKNKSNLAIKRKPSYRTSIAYGTRGGKEKTSFYVKNAILEGYRHVVTSSHHINHEEKEVGIGWKEATHQDPSILREELYLQTMFVPWDGNDFKSQPDDVESDALSMEEQVKSTIEQSLQNLQTTYIDAVLYHNFRAKLHPYEDMMKAWKELEKYVEKGTIRYLGMTNIHDIDYLKRFYDEAKVKPSIIQNRFHSNRNFDVSMDKFFRQYDIQIQRFWVLTGNGRAVFKNAEMAKRKALTPPQLMIAFVMSLGGEKKSSTVLVGTHDIQHLKEDLTVSKNFMNVFTDMNTGDLERKECAENIGMNLTDSVNKPLL